jgi:hypothetical protein
LEKLGANANMNNIWETIGENIKISAEDGLDYYKP